MVELATSSLTLLSSLRGETQCSDALLLLPSSPHVAATKLFLNNFEKIYIGLSSVKWSYLHAHIKQTK